jgi:hypothetical protein
MPDEVANTWFAAEGFKLLVRFPGSRSIAGNLLSAEQHILGRLDDFLFVFGLLPVVDDLLEFSLGVAEVIELFLLDLVLKQLEFP